MSKYLITALPRSGTLFLHSCFKRSRKITTIHDKYHGQFYKRYKTAPEDAFVYSNQLFKEGYVYISGFYRHFFDRYDVDKRGIILRHPLKYIVSSANMNSIKYANNVLDSIDELLETMDRQVENADVVYKFQDITSRHDILEQLLNDFGVDDVDVTKIDLNKKIHAKKAIFSLTDFDNELLESKMPVITEYVNKYGLDLV